MVNKHTLNQCEFHISFYLVAVVLFCIQDVPNSSFSPQTSSSD